MEDNKRVNERLVNYWAELCKAGELPDEADISPEALGDIWEDCFLIHLTDFDEQTEMYRYTYLGQHLIEAFGEDLTAHSVSEELIDPASHAMVGHLKHMVQTCQPVEIEAQFTNKHQMVVKYRGCVVPLAHEGEEGVAYALGAMKWKAY